jgi:hypothetical protein
MTWRSATTPCWRRSGMTSSSCMQHCTVSAAPAVPQVLQSADPSHLLLAPLICAGQNRFRHTDGVNYPWLVHAHILSNTQLITQVHVATAPLLGALLLGCWAALRLLKCWWAALTALRLLRLPYCFRLSYAVDGDARPLKTVRSHSARRHSCVADGEVLCGSRRCGSARLSGAAVCIPTALFNCSSCLAKCRPLCVCSCVGGLQPGAAVSQVHRGAAA